MPSYPPIWFLRHGQTEWNREARLQGQLDSPLTEQGRAEAARQARILPPILAQAPRIVASPLGRVRQTAEIALAGRAFETDPRLMEIHAGAWQGRLRDDILAEHPEFAARKPTALDIYEAAEGGERIAGLHARVQAFLQDLTGPTVVFAHGLLGQVLRAEAQGLPLAQAGALSNLQGVAYHLAEGREEVLEAPA